MTPRDQLIIDHIYLLKLLAVPVYCHHGMHIPLEDLVGYGNIGLVKAADAFDPSREVLFRTYASRRVHGAIIDGVRTWLRRNAYTAAPEFVSYESIESINQPADPASYESYNDIDNRLTLDQIRAAVAPRDYKLARIAEAKSAGATQRQILHQFKLDRDPSRASQLAREGLQVLRKAAGA